MRISDWSSDVGSSDLAVNALHIAEASHLDLGQHSIWLQRPSTVKLSHLMAASYPDMRSLGEARFQFLSTGRLPEDEFGDEGSPKRRDVFLTAVAMHRILLGTSPRSPKIGRASCRERVCQYV